LKMMKLNMSGNQIIDLIKKANKSLILLSNVPTADAVAAAFAWGEIVTLLGKSADIVSLGELPTTVGSLDKIDIVKRRLDPINLIISFNWAQSMIEKVSYSVDGEKFNLIITPTGKRLDPTEVEYSYRGADYNLILAIGIGNPNDLPINMIDKGIFDNIATINIDNQAKNTNFGKINVVDAEADSISGLSVEILKETQQTLTAKVADYLIFGLRAATNNFDVVQNPATFEEAAFCTRVKKENSETAPQNPKSVEEATEDWFSPKIMRSSKVS
jgi:nanoRNase/pAp phosphatase (c-di-AMP/oligoRNAs hydrolase)